MEEGRGDVVVLVLTQSFGQRVHMVLEESLLESNEIHYASRLCFADANIFWYLLHTYQANVDLKWWIFIFQLTPH